VATPANQRAVLVTGASTGIGRACALGFDKAGWQVFAGVRRVEDGESLRSEASPSLTPLIIDVTDTDSIERAAAAIDAAAPGGLAGLVNNAGVSAGGPLEFLPMEMVREAMEVNYFGQIAVTQAMLPLIRRGPGRIVNIGSVGGRSASGFLGPYAASKHAIEAFTDSLRQELRPWGIWVSVIEPGAVATPIWEKGARTRDQLVERMPPPALELYRPVLEAMPRILERQAKSGVPPERVFERVQHALTARRPKPRYVVGTEARIQLALKALLPTRTLDAVVARFLGI
jgi:NAD(P)-dependent dehydrogenase (short-subunit alcohol dehydrogenase family)